MNIDFDKVVELMTEGKAAISLVSNTIYEIKDNNLIAEGRVVDVEYLTKEEIEGEWQEVKIVETQEDYFNLTEEQKVKILTDSYEKYKSDLAMDRMYVTVKYK